ncbi:MAG TPA: Nramp family divalent metal transporter, partial [Blastocatellia bacterium]|nr:Nramp family divalent metal transporter [Blastocatellia bacterium]
LLWLATLSILAQFIYNIEVSRYTLYTGEPIMTGKFRLRPGPMFWLGLYLLLDFGAILPYQIANVATTVAAVFMGEIPDPERVPAHAALLNVLVYVMVVVALLPLIFGGKVYNSLKAIMSFKIVVVLGFLAFLAFFYSSAGTWREIVVGFLQFGNVPVDGSNVDNVFLSFWRGDGLPDVDRSALPLLTSFAAIAGVGGLAQMTISNYTREQGWGMGRHVGAIPSIIGGRNIQLSHVGTIFRVTPESLERWKGWYRHILRDQLVIWMPAALIGVALPSMLSVEFLPRGTVAGQWVLAGMTAGGVQERVGGALGSFFWHMVLFCGFLVLMPSIASNADGFIRRWLDACWTSTRTLRELNPHHIRRLYFLMLTAYIAVCFFFLSVARPMWLIVAYANLGNFALGFSCWHTLAVNVRLLPPELRPGWVTRISLFLAGLYFFALAILTALVTLGWL